MTDNTKFEADIKWKEDSFKDFSIVVNEFIKKLYKGNNIFNNNVSYAR